MSLQGCQIFKSELIEAIFPQTRQITTREIPMSFFANNLYNELWIEEIRAFMVNYSQIRRPCCTNNSIFFMSVTRQVLLADVFLFEYVFERKEKARFLKTSL